MDDLSEFEFVEDVEGHAFLRHVSSGELFQLQNVEEPAVEDTFVVGEPVPTTSEEVTLSASELGAGAARAWNVNETKMMLQLYKDNIADVGPLKKFKNKKQMWDQLSSEMEKQMGAVFSSLQIENRFKHILRRNMMILDHNRTSGNTRNCTPYDIELEEISGVDDSLAPELRMSAKIFQRKESVESCASSVPSTSTTPTPPRSPAFPPLVSAHSEPRRCTERIKYQQLLEFLKVSREAENKSQELRNQASNKLIETITAAESARAETAEKLIQTLTATENARAETAEKLMEKFITTAGELIKSVRDTGSPEKKRKT